MGNYYAEAQDEDEVGGARLRRSLRRKDLTIWFRSDPVSVAVALADKIDTLVGFWEINEKPTGSKDPLCASSCSVGRYPNCSRQ